MIETKQLSSSGIRRKTANTGPTRRVRLERIDHSSITAWRDSVNYKAQAFDSESKARALELEIRVKKAVWDPTAGQFRCPPETPAAGQFTNRLGEGCTTGFVRRLAARLGRGLARFGGGRGGLRGMIGRAGDRLQDFAQEGVDTPQMARRRERALRRAERGQRLLERLSRLREVGRRIDWGWSDEQDEAIRRRQGLDSGTLTPAQAPAATGNPPASPTPGAGPSPTTGTRPTVPTTPAPGATPTPAPTPGTRPTVPTTPTPGAPTPGTPAPTPGARPAIPTTPRPGTPAPGTPSSRPRTPLRPRPAPTPTPRPAPRPGGRTPREPRPRPLSPRQEFIDGLSPEDRMAWYVFGAEGGATYAPNRSDWERITREQFPDLFNKPLSQMTPEEQDDFYDALRRIALDPNEDFTRRMLAAKSMREIDQHNKRIKKRMADIRADRDRRLEAATTDEERQLINEFYESDLAELERELGVASERELPDKDLPNYAQSARAWRDWIFDTEQRERAVETEEAVEDVIDVPEADTTPEGEATPTEAPQAEPASPETPAGKKPRKPRKPKPTEEAAPEERATPEGEPTPEAAPDATPDGEAKPKRRRRRGDEPAPTSPAGTERPRTPGDTTEAGGRGRPGSFGRARGTARRDGGSGRPEGFPDEETEMTVGELLEYLRNYRRGGELPQPRWERVGRRIRDEFGYGDYRNWDVIDDKTLDEMFENLYNIMVDENESLERRELAWRGLRMIENANTRRRIGPGERTRGSVSRFPAGRFGGNNSGNRPYKAPANEADFDDFISVPQEKIPAGFRPVEGETYTTFRNRGGTSDRLLDNEDGTSSDVIPAHPEADSISPPVTEPTTQAGAEADERIRVAEEVVQEEGITGRDLRRHLEKEYDAALARHDKAIGTPDEDAAAEAVGVVLERIRREGAFGLLGRREFANDVDEKTSELVTRPLGFLARPNDPEDLDYFVQANANRRFEPQNEDIAAVVAERREHRMQMAEALAEAYDRGEIPEDVFIQKMDALTESQVEDDVNLANYYTARRLMPQAFTGLYMADKIPGEEGAAENLPEGDSGYRLATNAQDFIRNAVRTGDLGQHEWLKFENPAHPGYGDRRLTNARMVAVRALIEAGPDIDAEQLVALAQRELRNIDAYDDLAVLFPGQIEMLTNDANALLNLAQSEGFTPDDVRDLVVGRLRNIFGSTYYADGSLRVPDDVLDSNALYYYDPVEGRFDSFFFDQFYAPLFQRMIETGYDDSTAIELANTARRLDANVNNAVLMLLEDPDTFVRAVQGASINVGPVRRTSAGNRIADLHNQEAQEWIAQRFALIRAREEGRDLRESEPASQFMTLNDVKDYDAPDFTGNTPSLYDSGERSILSPTQYEVQNFSDDVEEYVRSLVENTHLRRREQTDKQLREAYGTEVLPWEDPDSRAAQLVGEIRGLIDERNNTTDALTIADINDAINTRDRELYELAYSMPPVKMKVHRRDRTTGEKLSNSDGSPRIEEIEVFTDGVSVYDTNATGVVRYRNLTTGEEGTLGRFSRYIYRRSDGTPDYIEHSSMFLTDQGETYKGAGVATVLNTHSLRYLQLAGHTKVNVGAASDGPYVWPRLGFRPKETYYAINLKDAMIAELEKWRRGRPSLVRNQQQANAWGWIANEMEAIRPSDLSVDRTIPTHVEAILAIDDAAAISDPVERGQREAEIKEWFKRLSFSGVLDLDEALGKPQDIPAKPTSVGRAREAAEAINALPSVDPDRDFADNLENSSAIDLANRIMQDFEALQPDMRSAGYVFGGDLTPFYALSRADATPALESLLTNLRVDLADIDREAPPTGTNLARRIFEAVEADIKLEGGALLSDERLAERIRETALQVLSDFKRNLRYFAGLGPNDVAEALASLRGRPIVDIGDLNQLRAPHFGGYGLTEPVLANSFIPGTGFTQPAKITPAGAEKPGLRLVLKNEVPGRPLMNFGSRYGTAFPLQQNGYFLPETVNWEGFQDSRAYPDGDFRNTFIPDTPLEPSDIEAVEVDRMTWDNYQQSYRDEVTEILQQRGIPLRIVGKPEQAPTVEEATPEVAGDATPEVVEEVDAAAEAAATAENVASLADALAAERGETPETPETPEAPEGPRSLISERSSARAAAQETAREYAGPSGTPRLNPSYRPRRAEGGEEAVGPTGARFTRDPGEWYIDPENPGTEAEAAAFLVEAEAALRNQRISNQVRLQSARAEANDLMENRGTALSSEEGAGDSDAADIEQARTRVIALELEQQEIDSALKRIYEGKYGSSEGFASSSVGAPQSLTPTGLPIPPERLLAYPTARNRVDELAPNSTEMNRAAEAARTRAAQAEERARRLRNPDPDDPTDDTLLESIEDEPTEGESAAPARTTRRRTTRTQATTPRPRNRRGEQREQPTSEAEDRMNEQQEELGTGSRAVVDEAEQQRNEQAIAEFEANRAERAAQSAARRRSRVGGGGRQEEGASPRIGPVRPAVTLDRDGAEQVESNYINYRKPFNVENEYESPALDRVFEMLPSLDPDAYDTELLAGSAVARAVKEFFGDTMNAETGGDPEKEWDNDYSLGRLYSYIQDMLNVESTEDRRAQAQRIVDGVDAIIARMQTGGQQ